MRTPCSLSPEGHIFHVSLARGRIDRADEFCNDRVSNDSGTVDGPGGNLPEAAFVSREPGTSQIPVLIAWSVGESREPSVGDGHRANAPKLG